MALNTNPDLLYTFINMIIITYSGKQYTYESKVVFEELRDFIWKNFGLKQGEFNIVYVDEEGDHITLGTKDDYEIVSSVQESTDTLNLIVTSTKKETLTLESPIEINVSGSFEEVSAEKKVEETVTKNVVAAEEEENKRDAERKKEADKKIKQEEKKRKEEEAAKKKVQQAEIKRLHKLEAARQKEEQKLLAKKAQDFEKDRQRLEKELEKQKHKEEKEKKKQQKKQKVQDVKQDKEPQPQVTVVADVKIKADTKPKKQDKKAEKKSVQKKSVEKKQTVQKIGEWDINKLNEVVEQRLKSLIPTLKKELQTEIKEKTVEQVKVNKEIFTIQLEYPTTVEDVTRMKNQAFEKVKAFYQAQHLKINQSLKQQKLKAAIIERERKAEEKREAKEKLIRDKMD